MQSRYPQSPGPSRTDALVENGASGRMADFDGFLDLFLDHPGRCSRPIRRFGTIPGNEDTFAALSTRTVIQIKPALISHDLPVPPVIRTPPRMVSEGVRNPSKSGHAPRRTILDQCVGSGRSRAVWISRLHVLHASLYVLGQILSPTISRDLPRSPAISHFEISGRSREIEPAIFPTCDVIDQKLRLSANFLKSIACPRLRRSYKKLSPAHGSPHPTQVAT